MKKGKVLIAMVLAMVLCVAMIGCAPAAPAASESVAKSEAPAETSAAAASESPAAADKQLSVALVPKVAVAFFDDCNTGGQEAAKALGVDYQWIAPENTQGSTQVRIMEDLIAKKVDGIAISVNEPKSVEAVIQQAVDAGIKVITFDSDSPDSARSMYIGTINTEAGKLMGQSLADLIGGKGKVAIVTGGLGANNLNERITGVEEALKEYPDVQIIDKQGTDDDKAKAVSVIESILRANPDLDGLFCMSQVGGPAAYQVLKTEEFSGLKGKLKVFAFDDLPDALAGVEEGYIDGIMVQRPITMGKMAVESLVGLIDGTLTDPQNVDTGCVVVSKDNLNSYTK